MPAWVKPPKLILAFALVPTLSPSTKVEEGLLVSNDSLSKVLLFLPLTNSILASANIPGPTIPSAPRLRLFMKGSLGFSGGKCSLSVVIGANGLPNLLIGMGAGCMFSPVTSSG